MWCYRQILRIPWTDRGTNVEVLRRMGMQNSELLEKIKERQLHFLGHALRGSAGEELKTIINEAATQKILVEEGKELPGMTAQRRLRGTGMKRVRRRKIGIDGEKL